MTAAPRLRPTGDRRELDELSLARARRGDRDGCARFVTFHQRLVFAAIGRIVGPGQGQAHVEDLAQEAFLKALRALPRFDPAGPAQVSTWLLTIATRVALSHLRRRRIETQPLHEGDAPAIHPHEAIDTRQRILRAAATLTPEQRAVFVLRDVHGLTETEVAEALELDVSAAKSRLHRARARMRRALTEAEHD